MRLQLEQAPRTTLVRPDSFSPSVRRPTVFFRIVSLLVISFILSDGLGNPRPIFAAQDNSPSESLTETTPATASTTSAPKTKASLNLLTLLRQGGWFMLPLTLLSLAVVTLIVERAIQLRRERLMPERFVRRLGQLADLPGGLNPREAYRICQSHPSTAADVIKSVLVKVGRPLVELEATLSESVQRRAIGHQQLVSWLGLAAAVAPLIGLLGTVWGITESFYDTTQLEVGQNRAEALSQGIYVALVTTICGLVIAVPATIAAHFFENRIVKVMNEIEELGLNLIPQFERYEGKVRLNPLTNSEDSTEATDSDFIIPPPQRI